MVQTHPAIEAHNAGSWKAETHFIGDRVSFLTGTSKARPEDLNQLTRHTGTVERREILRPSETATIGFVQYDIRDDVTGRVINVNSGRVRMLDNQERPAAPMADWEREMVGEEAAPIAPVEMPALIVPAPGVDANGRTYAPGDEVASVHMRNGRPAERGMVMKITDDGRPVVSFYGPGDELADVRPDCFVITSPAPAAPVAPVTRPCDYCKTDAHAGCPDCGTHPYMAGGRCIPCQARFRRAEREAGKTPRELYSMYISDGLADTDGYFAPLSFEAWARLEGHTL